MYAAVVVGAGLAGLATAEFIEAWKWAILSAILLDQESPQSLRGQALDGDADDHCGSRWTHACAEFAPAEKRAWLHEQGVRFSPVAGWDGTSRGGRLFADWTAGRAVAGAR